MIFTLCMDPLGSDDNKVLHRHLLRGSSPPPPSGGETGKGRENDAAKVSPQSEGASSLRIQAKPLSLSLPIRVSPRCLQIMYISSYSSERMHF